MKNLAARWIWVEGTWLQLPRDSADLSEIQQPGRNDSTVTGWIGFRNGEALFFLFFLSKISQSQDFVIDCRRRRKMGTKVDAVC